MDIYKTHKRNIHRNELVGGAITHMRYNAVGGRGLVPQIKVKYTDNPYKKYESMKADTDTDRSELLSKISKRFR